MILLFGNIPVTESYKIQKMVEKAQSTYASDFYDVSTNRWLGDELTVKSLFPSWILKEYEADTSNVLVVPLIKNYLRWLYSIDYGYGAQLEWENLRVPLYTNQIFLEAMADFYFPGADFASEPLSTVLPNIRKFAVWAKPEYWDKKGTIDSFYYLISTLLGIPWNQIAITNSGPCAFTIKVGSSYYSDFLEYDSFLQNHVYPAGMTVIYGTI
jgi:hypothetical protein